MKFLLYKMTLTEEMYIIARILDSEEFDRLMDISFNKPLLLTDSLKVARVAQENYKQKEVLK